MRTTVSIIVLMAPLGFAAPALAAGPHPADPGASVPPARYQSVTGGVRSYRPVGPKPWVRSNELVTPQPKPKPKETPGGTK